jgi:hypothetical protein
MPFNICDLAVRIDDVVARRFCIFCTEDARETFTLCISILLTFKSRSAVRTDCSNPITVSCALSSSLRIASVRIYGFCDVVGEWLRRNIQRYREDRTTLSNKRKGQRRGYLITLHLKCQSTVFYICFPLHELNSAIQQLSLVTYVCFHYVYRPQLLIQPKKKC